MQTSRHHIFEIELPNGDLYDVIIEANYDYKEVSGDSYEQMGYRGTSPSTVEVDFEGYEPLEISQGELKFEPDEVSPEILKIIEQYVDDHIDDWINEFEP